MTLKEAAHYLRVSTVTIYRVLWGGPTDLPAFRVGSAWRFSRAALDRWMRERSTAEGRS